VDQPYAHVPVLVEQVRELLAVRPGEAVVDATVGLGGHAAVLAEGLGKRGLLIGLEVDPANLEICRRRLADLPCRVELVRENFVELPAVLASLSVERVDVLFADLGLCSAQLEDGARGFSFLHDGRLDMRMDPRLTTTAADLVNRLKERELADLLFYNAQEYSSRRIARRICEVRREGRIQSTRHLAEIVAGALGVDPESRREKIHPATKTFQALRIAVNDEIRCLERLLEFAPDILRSGGRFGVISFHSIEDKPVKLDFRRRRGEGLYRIETKRPVVADAAERKANPRSRSAKLRVAVRLPEG
jgi:16S rRNA (cytosine1402-N4)-methyltransferase